ncbi:pyroglutamyl-peptidase I [Bdellovibrio bacteriovorus]|uniref:Pyroglutamyl-peptidase I n=1 Tax=Bdellovibrio bacteriovorus TaxID=959 RepID=A0A1Z3NB17_BDEBC|nr:pyroglutamyl-peptidase I [Bdellovibrio bacteriovorus]ASD64625.1 pyrrolidone-carboxylate peptidase [Bdellovibrio bacteriovorus]
MGKKILLTGFEPFLGEPVNPSQILLENIKRDLTFNDQVHTLLLPVSFAKAPRLVAAAMAMQDYDCVLMLGQAGGRKNICLERVGLNWNETEKPDEDGSTPVRGTISSQAPPALFTTAPVEQWMQILKEHQIPVEISLSAGGYVCNNVYFKTLQVLGSSPETEACFIHVPYLPEQAEGKPDRPPGMELETMLKAVKLILSSILQRS